MSAVQPRFRGQTDAPAQHGVAVSTVAIVAAIGAAGVAFQSAPILLFAVGAGAGYALSGSV